MSLLKTYRNPLVPRNLTEILNDFQGALYSIAQHTISKEDVVTLVAFYAEYGVAYLDYIASTFEEPKGASDSMKFMNSVIAEAINEAGLHYYNKERGWSVVDKAIQASLDNGGMATTNDIIAILDEIEESYIEEEEVFFEDAPVAEED